MKIARLALLGAGLLSAAGAAQALEFKSVGATPAILYDAPSSKGRKVFVAPRGMPVEVVLTYGEWTKVRDAAGSLSWVESKSLSPKRTVITGAPGVRVRESATDTANVVFTAEKGVLLDFLDASNPGWVRVRHIDGQAGFIRAGEVWGE
ncbi:MAG TPA: SH3 domain-containing protein [Noviherbaspirillum sp.]|jgi:SH3-like domain-containing protein|uniref:SH3 domain-containing protein n=1 Tax=Noviherbaspirillum sp. TaxID=1926288 RepID=UPI002F95A8DE